MIVEAIGKLVQKEHLTQEQSKAVFNQIMCGEATDAQIGAYLIAQRLSGETQAEIAGAAEVMREKATPIPVKSESIIDTCGTGGDKSNTFNVSTTCAFVLAAAGLAVAKHGNRSVSSSCGSADVLQELGVNLDITPTQVAQCVDEIGIGFLFAPKLHGAMKHAIGPRKEIGQRSIFNLLGPLTNPAGAKHQLMGVFDGNYTSILAHVLGDLGANHAWVVHGEDGLDEITLTASTKVAEYKDGKVNEFTINPVDLGYKLCTKEELAGGSLATNAQIVKDILNGMPGPKKEIVELNAGAAIYIGGKASSLAEGVAKARAIIDSKKALKKLEELKQLSNSLGEI